MNGEALNGIADPKPMSRPDLVKWFRLSAGTILALTAAAKLLSLISHATILATPDPSIGIPFRYLMLAGGALELSAALVCFLSRNQILAVGMVGWVATLIGLYRVNLWWLDWRIPCGCLGTFTDTLHLSADQADTIMKAILGYLLLGSYAFLIRWWWERRAQNKTVRGK